jgi:hypothetical protein
LRVEFHGDKATRVTRLERWSPFADYLPPFTRGVGSFQSRRVADRLVGAVTIPPLP